MDTGIEQVKENPIKEITTYTDSRDVLAKARQQADERNFDDIFIADIDAHHTETESWREIIAYIDDPVVRAQAEEMVLHRSGTPPYGLNGDLALRYQDVGGRIPHQAARSEKIDESEIKEAGHRDLVLAKRAYEAMSIDVQVVFPTPMLFLGMHPQFDMEAILGKAYNRWQVENILKKDPKLKTMMFLPFNDPESALETIEEFGDAPGCVGFMVTSVRYKAVHHNHYMKVYRALEERGLPIGFHAGYYWQDPKNEDLIIVDGGTGKVIVNPSEQSLVEYEVRKIQYEDFKVGITQDSHLKAETTDGVQLEVMANIELPEEVFAVKDYGGDGIGLYRTEFQYMNRAEFPSEQELFDKYRDVVEVMAPKSVTIRTLDINGDKAVANHTSYDEINPALGLRAIRYCLRKPDVFRTQLRAILKAAAFGNVRILFPMISAYFEICKAKKLLDQAAESLEKEGLPYNREIDIGIMIEVPSAAVVADLLAEKVDFFSIGTNDLIQYTLAIDRGNPHVADLYQPLDPAIIRMIKQVADVSKDKGIGLFICGEMAATPLHIPLLLGMGMDELSMNPQSIPQIKRVIRSLNVKDAQSFVREALTKKTARGVFELSRDAFGDMISEVTFS